MTDAQNKPTTATPLPTWTVFVLPILIVTFLALTYWTGICLAITVTVPLGILVECFDRQERFWAVPLLFAGLVAFVGILVLFGISEMSPEPSRRMCCHSNLEKIGAALRSYHEEYRSFPPAYIADDEGWPIHSWRVLLLPFLEGETLYEQYRFDEPWNGPNNIKLVDKMPTIFRCPSNRSEEKTYTTNYVVVVGPHTAWPGENSVRFADIADGTSNTWLVVEAADSGITWSEPRDLHVLQMTREINPPTGQGISSKHIGGAQVVYADASVRFIADASSPEDVRKLLTIDDGEKVDLDR